MLMSHGIICYRWVVGQEKEVNDSVVSVCKTWSGCGRTVKSSSFKD